jgi:sugar phosphate isomerase/epimerase
MANKIILSSGALYDRGVEAFFKIAQKSGFDGVEVMADDDPESHNAKRLKQYRDKYCVPILSIHSPLDKCKIWGDDPENVVNKSMALATALGASVVVAHPFRRGVEGYYDKLHSWLEKKPKSETIKIAVENMPDNGVCDLESQDPARLMHDFCTLCLDTSHLATTGHNFLETVAEAARKIIHVHLADSRVMKNPEGKINDDHYPVGEGKLPLGDLLHLLRQDNFRGHYCLELRPDMFRDLSNRMVITRLREIIANTRCMVTLACSDTATLS